MGAGSEFFGLERRTKGSFSDFHTGSGLPDVQPGRQMPAGLRHLVRVTTACRPPRRPRFSAACNPAFVPSRMRSRSNCASAPNMWNTKRPPEVVVSMFSVIDRNPTPLDSISVRCFIDRPRRSSFQTVNVSLSRTLRMASARPGRSALTPEALSSNSFSQPALRKASSCSAVS